MKDKLRISAKDEETFIKMLNKAFYTKNIHLIPIGLDLFEIHNNKGKMNFFYGKKRKNRYCCYEILEGVKTW